MTIIKYQNFVYFVNGKPVSDEYAQCRIARKREAEVRLSIMRQVKAFRKLQTIMPSEI